MNNRLLQAHISPEKAVLFWVENGTIVHRWDSEEVNPPGLETILADLQLVFEAAEAVVDDG